MGGIGIGDRALPAPQAGLMAQMAQGIVGGEMPWALIVFGMALAVFLILLKAPSVMLVAVGMYLPPETTGAIFLGGCLKALVDWRAKQKAASAEQSAAGRGHGHARGLGPDRRRVAHRRPARGPRARRPRTSRRSAASSACPQMGWVDGPLGRWASLVPLGGARLAAGPRAAAARAAAIGLSGGARAPAGPGLGAGAARREERYPRHARRAAVNSVGTGAAAGSGARRGLRA